MKKRLLYTLLFLLPYGLFAQDYAAIDQYLQTNLDLKGQAAEGEDESLTLLLTVNDCDNCIPLLYSYLKNIPKNKPYAVNIVTDNIAYAKKVLGDVAASNDHLYHNATVFTTFLAGRSGLYFKDMNGAIFGDKQDIQIKLKNAQDRQAFFGDLNKKAQVLLQDSLLSSIPFISSTALPNNQLLVFDSKMGLGLFLDIKEHPDSLAVVHSQYYTPIFTNPTKLFHLSGATSEDVSFEEMQKIALAIHTHMIKLYTITYWDGQYYATFSITRAFKKDNQTKLYSTYFVGTKKAEHLDPQTILDPSTYDHYYRLEDLPYEGNTYRMTVYAGAKPQIVDDNKLNWRLRMPNNQGLNQRYSGLGTLKLQDKTAQLIAIDPAFEEFIDLNLLLKWKNKTYYLSRQITDEATNQGYLFLREFNSPYINDYLQKVKTL